MRALSTKSFFYLLQFVVFMTMVPAITSAQTLPPGQIPPGPPPAPGQLGPPPETLPKSAPPDARPVPAGTTQQQHEAVSEEAPTFTVGKKLIYVSTTVTDKRTGGYVNGLTSADFQVYDNHKLQKIESDLVDQPVSIVLAVQANSEIEPVLPQLRHAGILLQGLVSGKQGDLAILAFDHRMQNLTGGFTNNPNKIDDAMQKLTAGSSTAAVIDAVFAADRMLDAHDPHDLRRRVIVLLSRNVDKGSQASLKEAIDKLQFDNVIVYAINISKFLTALMEKQGYPRPAYGGIPPTAMPTIPHYGPLSETDAVKTSDGNWLNAVPPLFRSVRDLFKKTPAEAFASFTGGRIYNFGTEKGLDRAITDIGEDVNSQYVLTYAPNDLEEPGFHSIKVVVNRPDLLIDARPGYYTAGGQQQQ
ncbi:MAG: VWA domain-containing protein [Bryobacteraceae bacterium]